MSDKVTVAIPQKVYDRAQQLAAKHNKAVADVLTEALEMAEVIGSEMFAEEKAMAIEEAAYQAMRDDLVAEHAGDFVAIYEGQLIDHDVDELALLQRLDAYFPNKVVLMKKVVRQPVPELRFRSPRLDGD